VSEETRSRERLLAVSPVTPWPCKGGFSLRANHLLRHLARDWDITLVVASGESEVRMGLDPSPGHELVSVRVVRQFGPAPSHRTEMDLLRRTVDELLATRRPRAALLFPGTEFLAFGRKDFPPSVADRIDCGALERARYIRRARALRGFGAICECVRQAWYERRLVREVASTVVAGEDDRRAIERLSGRRTIHLIRNGVDAAPRIDFGAEHPRPTLAFTGTLSYYANVDAAVYFVRRMWPAILRRVPNARVLIAGRSPSRRVRELGRGPGVEIRADVEDMGALISESWVAVAPMRCGAGVKNKILEAWAVGRPAVLTPIAANGLDLGPDMRSFVTGSRKEFCDLVVALLEDRGLRHRSGIAAHQRAVQRHSWADSARGLSDLLREVSRPSPAS
jgi:glycosyltransferase involved in cell wall biosynthesis